MDSSCAVIPRLMLRICGVEVAKISQKKAARSLQSHWEGRTLEEVEGKV